MELRDYVIILLRRKLVIIITVAAALAIVVIGTRIQTPVYQASVTLRISSMSSGQTSTYSTTYVTQLLNTTALIATSGPVLEELMTHLALTHAPVVTSEVIPNTELIKITVEDPSPGIAAKAAGSLADILILESNEVYSGGGKSPQEVLGEQLSQAEKKVIQLRQEYDQAVIATPPNPQNADLLYQSLLLKQRNYETLLSQYQQSLYQQEMRSNMITVVEKPVIPVKPAKPRVIYNLVLGFAVGLLGGVILAFLVDNFDTTLHSIEDIELYSGVKAISKIPKVNLTQMELSSANGNFIFAEAFRDLAMRIQRLSLQKPLRVILVFSTQPNQGKSVIVSHLAVHLAECGKKVVAVDCDLRMPRIHNWFNLPNEVGLKDFLEKKKRLDNVLQKSGYTGLSVITGGAIVQKPQLLLGSEQMKKLIMDLGTRFDYILLDTPPLFVAGDVDVLSECADGLLLVARIEKSNRESIQAAGLFMKGIPDKFTGLIVNQVENYNRDYYRRPNKKRLYDILQLNHIFKK